MKNTVYIEVRHMDFWWGIYGFCDKTSWEDITIYEMKDSEFCRLATTCVCAKSYFMSGLEDLEDDPDEADFVHAIKEFLSSDSIRYHYYYDRPSDEDFYEVPFEAKRNENNIKPRTIETWFPSGGIGFEEAEHCAIEFCRKFLSMDVDEVLFKEVICREEALEEYISETETFNNCKSMVFADELVEQLSNKWNKTNEKVIEILNKSLK